MKKRLSFWTKVLLSCAVHLLMAVILLELAEAGGLPLIILTPAVAIILAAVCCYRGQMQNIWFIPLSQALLTFFACVFLYIRYLLGLRPSGGFIDFGVSFEIGIIALWGLVWLIPSAIAATVYLVVKRRARTMQESSR